MIIFKFTIKDADHDLINFLITLENTLVHPACFCKIQDQKSRNIISTQHICAFVTRLSHIIAVAIQLLFDLFLCLLGSNLTDLRSVFAILYKFTLQQLYYLSSLFCFTFWQAIPEILFI